MTSKADSQPGVGAVHTATAAGGLVTTQNAAIPPPPGHALLLHAAGSGPRALQRLAKALAQQLGRVDAINLDPLVAAAGGGGGENGKSGALTTSPVMSGDVFDTAVAAICQLLPDERAGGRSPRLLVGHSMGGLIALLALARGIQVDAAVLYEPIALALLDPGDPQDRDGLVFDAACIAAFRGNVAAGRTEAGVAAFIEAYGGSAWSALPPPVRLDLVARAPHLLAQALATNAQPLAATDLAHIRIPTLILRGTESPPVTHRMGLRVAASLPDAECLDLSGLGHMGPVTAPDTVARAIVGFLRRREMLNQP